MPYFSRYIWSQIGQHRGRAIAAILCYEALYVVYLLYPDRNIAGYSPAVVIPFLLFNVFAFIALGVTLEMLAQPLARARRAPWAIVVALGLTLAAALHGGTASAVNMGLMVGVPVAAAWFIDEELLSAGDVERFAHLTSRMGLPTWVANEVAELRSLEERIVKQHAQGEPWTPQEQLNLVETRAAISERLAPHATA